MALPTGAGRSPAALEAFAERALGAKGRVVRPRPQDEGGILLRYTRPSSTLEVAATPDRSAAVITTTRYGWLRAVRWLHVLTGYAGGPAFVVWSILLDLVALAVIGFALSGIYLWYKLTRHRRLGWLLLGGSWCYTLAVILYFWFG